MKTGLKRILNIPAITERSKATLGIREFMKLDLEKHIALKESHKDLTDTLELLLTDVAWNDNSPTLKLIKRMIKRAKKL